MTVEKNGTIFLNDNIFLKYKMNSIGIVWWFCKIIFVFFPLGYNTLAECVSSKQLFSPERSNVRTGDVASLYGEHNHENKWWNKRKNDVKSGRLIT